MNDGTDRKAVCITRIDEVESDLAFWKTQPHRRRLSTVEELRHEYHGGQDGPPSDFREFMALLNEHDVRYMVVGGYAVAFHGHPRYTKDIDVWLERTPDNARRLLRALNAFGFGSVGLDESDFLKPYHVIRLGEPPNRIDLFTDLKSVEFEAAYGNRESGNAGDVAIQFIGLEDLKRSKLAAGRLQDLADLDNLGLL